jgi:hypothetical protein
VRREKTEGRELPGNARKRKPKPKIHTLVVVKYRERGEKEREVSLKRISKETDDFREWLSLCLLLSRCSVLPVFPCCVGSMFSRCNLFSRPSLTDLKKQMDKSFTFPRSGQVIKNRIIKAPMSEDLGLFSSSHMSAGLLFLSLLQPTLEPMSPTTSTSLPTSAGPKVEREC